MPSLQAAMARRTVSGSISGVSPERTTTSSAAAGTAARPTRTASPVPLAGDCTTTRQSGSAAVISSAVSGPATTTTSSAPASRAARATQASIGSPHNSCRTFGRGERIRVPSPPAMMIVEMAVIGAAPVGARAQSNGHPPR